MRELIDDLGSRAKQTAAAVDQPLDQTPTPLEATVLCLPARDEADEIAGAMLEQLLEAKGIRVMLMSAQTLSGEMVMQVSEQAVTVVCVSALPPLAATHARYIGKRLRPRYPNLKIVVGLWQTTGRTKKAHERMLAAGIDQFVTTLAEATQQLSQLVASQQLLIKAETVRATA
jgi:methylmalonyl-CoA mutase cobalamin-binding subunit